MKIFLTSLMFFICYQVSAQQNRFIYLQTENRQPFFAKLDNKIINSSPFGYLIIPKLDDGLYSIIIGFPENTNEQEFNCSIKNKDVGFIIKNTGEKEWQLLNVQTNNVIVPGGVSSKPVIVYEKETDPFSTMLANAVNDSTILRKDIVKQTFVEKPNEINTKDTIQAIVLNNDVAVEKTNDLSQSDTSKIIITTEVAVTNPENKVISDSTKKDIAKEIVPEKPIELTQKDSSLISTNDVAVVKPENIIKADSITNKDIAKEIITEKSGETIPKDNVQSKISSDVAVAKSKKKKAKKNDNALQDSSQQQDIVKVIPEKVIENKEIPKIVDPELALRSVIKRKSKKTNKYGVEMIYIDDNGETKDTIRILIPSEKKKKSEGELIVTDVTVPDVQVEDKAKAKAEEKKKSDYKISEKEKEIIKEANTEHPSKLTMINSDCKNFATDDDFLKIRKKMVAENNDEDMIKAARKIFKTKCFTTEQIKNLSVLFLKDQGKYLFFNTAYAFVSDSEQYYTLEKQLTDNTYITLFRSMINK